MSTITAHPALQRRPDAGWALCQLVSDWVGRVPAGGAIVEPKYDGMRALWIDHEIVSREGAPIYGTEHIAERLRAMEHEACEPMFFDGEFQVGGSFGATVAHFKAAGGRGNAGTLHLFDALPMRVWRGDGPCEALEVRRPKLDRLASPFVGNGLELTPWAFMTDAADIEARARYLIQAGGEGVVVKDALSTYRRTRSANWQRIRKALTLDLPCVGHAPHRGNEDGPGSPILDHAGVRVHVSAGVPREVWDARHGLVGMIVEVEAMEQTERGSLRQARFVRLRPDKVRAMA